MSKKTLFIAAAILLSALFVGAAMMYDKAQLEQAGQVASENRAHLQRMHSPTLGVTGAPVEIVEFLDPACEACRSFYPLVKKLMADNPDKIRLVLRYAPFHRGADQVVAALEGARRQGLFWETLESLLAAQSQWTRQHVAHPELIWPFLERVPGLDLDQVRADMARADVAAVIAQDLSDAKALNVTKTPTFFVNGQPLPRFGYQPLKALVDAALAGAA